MLNLPQSVENTLKEQLEKIENLTVETLRLKNEAFNLVVCQHPALPGSPIAVPVFPLTFQRQERLGTLLRQMFHILEEPVPWLHDFMVGPYLFRPGEKLLLRKEGLEIALTDRETDILVYLARHLKPVPREDLLKHIWRYHESVDTHTLETHIYRLRQKIEERAETPRILLTEEGGYRLKCSGIGDEDETP